MIRTGDDPGPSGKKKILAASVVLAGQLSLAPQFQVDEVFELRLQLLTSNQGTQQPLLQITWRLRHKPENEKRSPGKGPICPN